MLNIRSSEEFLDTSMSAIRDYIGSVPEEYIVWPIWYCKTIQNHKGIFGTSLMNGKIYECTYNGDKKELYVDEYIKINKIICK